MSQLSHLAGSLLVDVARLTVWLVLLTTLFVPIERWFALRKEPRQGPVAPDIALYFVNSLVPAAVLGIPLSVIAAVAERVTPESYLSLVDRLPFIARMVLGLMVAELGSYWAHRWTHSSAFLWRFHAIHHAPARMNWLVNTRAHPTDVIFTRLGGLVPLYLLGLASPDPTYGGQMIPVYVTLFGTLWAFFIHANVRWRLGLLEWIVATPAFHHWHHTNDEHRDRNFAALFPIVDRLFGTYHLPRHWPPCYGVDTSVPGTTLGQMLEPLGIAAPAPRRLHGTEERPLIDPPVI